MCCSTIKQQEMYLWRWLKVFVFLLSSPSLSLLQVGGHHSYYGEVAMAYHKEHYWDSTSCKGFSWWDGLSGLHQRIITRLYRASRGESQTSLFEWLTCSSWGYAICHHILENMTNCHAKLNSVYVSSGYREKCYHGFVQYVNTYTNYIFKQATEWKRYRFNMQ